MERFAEDVFVVEDEVRFYGFRLQTRMGVLRLPGDELILYSPVWPSAGLERELAAVGQVTHVVSPNKIHNQTLAAWARIVPDATLVLPPGLAERRPELSGHVLEAEAPESWSRGGVAWALTAGNVLLGGRALSPPFANPPRR